MDTFGERGQLIENMEDMIAYSRELGNVNENQGSLFGETEDSDVSAFKLKESAEINQEEKLVWEKELLGLYISGHPLDKWREQLEKREINIKRIKEEFGEGMLVSIAGIVEESRIIITKNNQQMAFLKIADLTDHTEAVVFPSTFRKVNDILVVDNCITLRGRVSLRNGEKSIIIEEAKAI